MIFIIAIRSQTIFLIVARMTWHPLIRMNLLDMGSDLLVDDRGGWRLAGTIIVNGHGGQVVQRDGKRMKVFKKWLKCLQAGGIQPPDTEQQNEHSRKKKRKRGSIKGGGRQVVDVLGSEETAT